MRVRPAFVVLWLFVAPFVLAGGACSGGDEASTPTVEATDATVAPSAAATAPTVAPPAATAEALDLAPLGSPDPRLVSRLEGLVAGLPPLEGETDRDQIRSALGPPDAFEITFELVDTAGVGVDRAETWFYYDLESAYGFANGALVSNLPIDEQAGLLLTAPQYDPGDFDRAMTWDDVRRMLVDPDAATVFDVSDELGEPLVAYVGEQLLAVFDPGGLVYVEAVALQGTPE